MEEGPGLKPAFLLRLIQGPEGPCSFPKALVEVVRLRLMAVGGIPSGAEAQIRVEPFT
jgi:hypothetical protein